MLGLAALTTALSLVPVQPAGAALTDNFVTAGNAQARWINEPAAPPGSTDRQSIELAVNARSPVDFNDAAWVAFRGFAEAPPATPPSFLYKISQAGASGGSVRLVIRFDDGGYGFLRPVTLEPSRWALANGAGNNWETKGRTACGSSLSYAQMVACHPGARVTSLEIINDSGWLYNGRFSALVDNISYGGEVFSAPAPPVLGEHFNVAPVSGKVLVRLPEPVGPARASATRPSDLDRVDGTVQGLPPGSRVDTRRGTVKLTSARGRRGRQSGNFSGSVFTVGQTKKGRNRGVTTLRLEPSSRRRCNTSARRSTAGGPLADAARRRRGLLRRLRGRARGRFRTRGRYSSAIVRGTRWTISDRCEGTLVSVQEGVVAVRDLRRRRTVLVRRGQRYLARAPGY
jgi:hypothetical protein